MVEVLQQQLSENGLTNDERILHAFDHDYSTTNYNTSYLLPLKRAVVIHRVVLLTLYITCCQLMITKAKIYKSSQNLFA